MPARYYSITEVNKLLPAISELMGEFLERRAMVVSKRKYLLDIFDNSQRNMGSAEATAIAFEIAKIEQLAEKIQSYGCQIKDLNGGTIDFLSRYNQHEVYLCWRYGEPLAVTHYHLLESGFMGRQQIHASDDFWTPITE